MNPRKLKIFSQNVRKNKILTDIIFLQEPPRYLCCYEPNHSNLEGDPIYGAPLHPEWTLFARYNNDPQDTPRVVTYINNRCKKLRFSLRNDIVNHRDINIISFYNGHSLNFLINVYSDEHQCVLEVLRDTPPALNNVLLMTGDFNIRDNDWDPSFPHYSLHSDDLLTIADSFGLDLSSPIQCVPTRYADNRNDSNSVLDLAFLLPNNIGFNQHKILPDIRKLLDHMPLIIEVGIQEDDAATTKQSIKKDSNQEKDFIKDITSNIRDLNTANINSKEKLELCVDQLSKIFHDTWNKHSKTTYITKHSKEWWNSNCTNSLNKYRNNSNIENWKNFKNTIKTSKKEFFDTRIFEIALSNKRPWDLMSWVQKKSLLAIKAMTFQGSQCVILDQL